MLRAEIAARGFVHLRHNGGGVGTVAIGEAFVPIAQAVLAHLGRAGDEKGPVVVIGSGGPHWAGPRGVSRKSFPPDPSVRV